MKPATMISIAFVAIGCAKLEAQDAPQDVQAIQQQQNEGTERFADELQSKNRQALAQQVLKLTERAAHLRLEHNFIEAAKLDLAIRQALFENDPRLIRINEFKRRVSNALLEGNILDAEMYDREANRILSELDANSGVHKVSDNARDLHATGFGMSPMDVDHRIGVLEHQIQSLASELRTLNNRLNLRSPQVSP